MPGTPVIAPIVTMTAWSDRKSPAATANLRTGNLSMLASLMMSEDTAGALRIIDTDQRTRDEDSGDGDRAKPAATEFSYLVEEQDRRGGAGREAPIGKAQGGDIE